MLDLRYRLIPTGLCLGLASAPLIALADNPDSRIASAATLTPITVTASKTATSTNDLPVSVSILDREALGRTQPATLGDALEHLPNVNVYGGPRGAGQSLNIRGISQERILFLVDGARQNFRLGHSAAIFVEPDLLDTVEVLRGPASALWGSGAVGGVVALRTRNASDLLRPGQQHGARLKLGYHSGDHQWLTSGALYGVTGSGLDYLLNLSYRDADDIRLGDGSDLEHSGFERRSGLAKLRWSPNAVSTLSASLMMLDQDEEVPSNAQILGNDSDLTDRTTRQTNLALRYDRDDPASPWLNPSALLYHNRVRVDTERQRDDRRDETLTTTTGADLRNSMRFGTGDEFRQVLTYGLNAYRSETEGKRNGARRDSHPGGHSDVFGIFAQDEILLGRRWTLVPGLRWDRFSSKADHGDLTDNNDSAFSASLGVDVKITDWLSLQASYAEAFRAPDVQELFVSGTHFTCGRGCANLFVPNPDLKPEQAHNKELGLRLHRAGLFTPGDEGRFQARVFRNDVDDFIDQIVNFVFRPVPGNPGRGGISTFRNVAAARLEGFELTADYQARHWFAEAAYARTRGEDRDSGEPLGSVAPDTWSLGAGLQFPAQGLRFGWRGRFVSEQDRVPEEMKPSKRYNVHDLWLTWRPVAANDALKLELTVNNLLDEDYQPYGSTLKARGRDIMANVSYRF